MMKAWLKKPERLFMGYNMQHPQGSFNHLVQVIQGLVKNDPSTTRLEAAQTVLDNGDWFFDPQDLDQALDQVFGKAKRNV